jgi:hypothetical protein
MDHLSIFLTAAIEEVRRLPCQSRRCLSAKTGGLWKEPPTTDIFPSQEYIHLSTP